MKVTWRDAFVDLDAEVSIAEIKDGLKVAVDIGALIRKNRKVVIIAGNIEDEGDVVRFITKIPAVLVLKIEKAIGFETIYEKNGAKDEKNEPKSPLEEP